jgi:tetratricopeptide (TPR) repeat protein
MRAAFAVVLVLGVPIGATAAQESLPTIPPAPAGTAAPQPDATEALLAARKLVDLTEQQYGPHALQLVNPLLSLATTQRRLQDYSGAENNYRRAASIVDAHEGASSHDLITALTGLSAIYSENGDYASSVQLLQRAIDVSRKLDGLLNPQQLEMVESLIADYLALGDYDSVLREQQLALRIAVAAYGKDIPRLVAALERNAGWSESMGRYNMARALHSRTLMIASNLGKEKNLTMVEPLRGIARTHRLELINGVESPSVDATGSSGFSRPNNEGEVALQLVLEIVDAHPESGATEHAKALMDLGDWRMFAGYPDKALDTYREAWAALRAPGGGGTAAFDAPAQIHYRPPGSARRPATSAERFAEHFVEVEFTVTANGEVRDVTLTASDVPGKTSKQLVRAIKGARYRPRFVDGVAVDTSGMKYRETIYVPRS